MPTKSDDLTKKLRADFPEESVQVKMVKEDKSGESKVYTGYKPAYIFERLNDIFGPMGWDNEIIDWGHVDEKDGSKDIWAKVKLTVRYGGMVCVKEQCGTSQYNKNFSIGDALKSAVTNATEKCASMFDVGIKAYKGLLELPKNHPMYKKAKKVKEDSSAKDKRKDLLLELVEECKKYGIEKSAFPALVKNVLNEEIATKNLTEDNINQLIKHVKKNKSPF